MYLSGNQGNYAGRIHSLPTGLTDVDTFILEGDVYVPSVATYISNKWDKELRKQKYNLSGIDTYLSEQQLGYTNKLVYKQTNGQTTTVNAPPGIYDLTSVTPKITEIHCHSCSTITSIICNNNASLTLVDLKNLSGLTNLSFVNCATLDTVKILGITSLSNGVTCENSPLLRVFTCPNLVSVGGVGINLRTSGNINLTGAISFPSLVSSSGPIFVYGIIANSKMTSFSAPLLTTAGSYIIIANQPTLMYVNLPSLQTVGADLNLSNNSLVTSISLPSLISVGGTFYFSNNTGLTTLSANNLNILSSLNCGECSSITNIDFPSLTIISSYISAYGMDSLTSISIPNLTMMAENSVSIYNCPFLTQFNYGSALFIDGVTIDMTANALNQSTIHNIIESINDISAESTTCYLSGGTNSSPDATRATMVTNLNIAGCDITTN
jgi:hypothetical protein